MFSAWISLVILNFIHNGLAQKMQFDICTYVAMQNCVGCSHMGSPNHFLTACIQSPHTL